MSYLLEMMIMVLINVMEAWNILHELFNNLSSCVHCLIQSNVVCILMN